MKRVKAKIATSKWRSEKLTTAADEVEVAIAKIRLPYLQNLLVARDNGESSGWCLR
jgi:hypothetical protein